MATRSSEYSIPIRLQKRVAIDPHGSEPKDLEVSLTKDVTFISEDFYWVFVQSQFDFCKHKRMLDQSQPHFGEYGRIFDAIEADNHVIYEDRLHTHLDTKNPRRSLVKLLSMLPASFIATYQVYSLTTYLHCVNVANGIEAGQGSQLEFDVVIAMVKKVLFVGVLARSIAVVTGYALQFKKI